MCVIYFYDNTLTVNYFPLCELQLLVQSMLYDKSIVRRFPLCEFLISVQTQSDVRCCVTCPVAERKLHLSMTK